MVSNARKSTPVNNATMEQGLTSILLTCITLLPAIIQWIIVHNVVRILFAINATKDIHFCMVQNVLVAARRLRDVLFAIIITIVQSVHQSIHWFKTIHEVMCT